jgi:hypothetical protein
MDNRQKVVRYLDTSFSKLGVFERNRLIDLLHDETQFRKTFSNFKISSRLNINESVFREESLRLLNKYNSKNTKFTNNANITMINRNNTTFKNRRGVNGNTFQNFTKTPYKMLKNVNLTPMLNKMYTSNNAFLSVCHGAQVTDSFFVVPNNVSIVLLGTNGLSMTNPQAIAYTKLLKNKQNVKEIITNPLWKRKSIHTDDLLRNRLYFPPGSKILDIMLKYKDATRTMGIFPIVETNTNGSIETRLPEDFEISARANEVYNHRLQRLKQIQKKYTLLPVFFDTDAFLNEYGDLRDVTQLSVVAKKLSEYGGGTLLAFNCRDGYTNDNKLYSMNQFRKMDKQLANVRRRNINEFNLKQIEQGYIREGIRPVVKVASTNRYIEVPPTYLSKLIRLYKLGKKTSKTFNNYTHKNMIMKDNGTLTVNRTIKSNPMYSELIRFKLNGSKITNNPIRKLKKPMNINHPSQNSNMSNATNNNNNSLVKIRRTSNRTVQNEMNVDFANHSGVSISETPRAISETFSYLDIQLNNSTNVHMIDAQAVYFYFLSVLNPLIRNKTKCSVDFSSQEGLYVLYHRKLPVSMMNIKNLPSVGSSKRFEIKNMCMLRSNTSNAFLFMIKHLKSYFQDMNLKPHELFVNAALEALDLFKSEGFQKVNNNKLRYVYS